MSTLKNDRFLCALLRQAGRYLPEYRATREKAGDFLSLCQNPELACEVTLQPLDRFPLDAATLFSDILTIPDAMGLCLYFEEGEGPRFRHPVQDKAAIDALPVPDPEEELRYVMDAVRTIRRELNGRVLLRQPLDPGYLHGGRLQHQELCPVQGHDVRPPGAHARPAGQTGAIRDFLSQRPDRRRRPGGDDLRHLGRHPHALGLQEFSLAYMQRIVEGLTREAEGRTAYPSCA